MAWEPFRQTRQNDIQTKSEKIKTTQIYIVSLQKILVIDQIIIAGTRDSSM